MFKETIMKRIKVLALILTGFICVDASAQQGTWKMNLNYSTAFPMGNYKDFIENYSFRGWQGSIQYGITDKISLGLGAGYQDFYHKAPRAVYQNNEGGHVSAVVSHSIQTIPILIQGKYNFLPQAAIQPYVGLGIGGNLVMFREFLGEFGTTTNTFRFAARPEAGVYIPFQKGGETGITIGGIFNYMPFNKAGVDNLNNVGVYAGVAFPLRR
jgi:outer membrane protein W